MTFRHAHCFNLHRDPHLNYCNLPFKSC